MMTSYFNLLKYAQTGIASPDMTYYDRMRASTLMGGVVKTLTGQPPLSFKSDGTQLISWSMKGNGSQSGTPTPDAPIMPDFVGVRTGNLFDKDSISYPTDTTIKYFPIEVPDGTYTLSTNFPDFDTKDIFFLAGNASSGASSSGNGVSLSTTRIRTAEDGYVTVAMRYNEARANPADYDIMLNSGSSALPYEPFGWKIPITCAGQTVPVYLGQTQTVRRIGKLVLTGEENIEIKSGNAKWYIPIADMKIPASVVAIEWYCSHYQAVANYATWTSYDYMISWSSADTGSSVGLRIRDIDFLTGVTLADFKSYLAAQYAAGHPVTIWYVLAEPETAIVNELLCKIGNYADELSSTDAGVAIPTVKGNNTLTVETDLQPSEMSITYRG